MVGQEEFPGLHFWGTPGVRVRSEGVLEFDVSPSLLPSLSPSISSINNFLNKHLLHVRESMLLMCERCVNQGSHAPRACGGCSGGCDMWSGGEYAEDESHSLISGRVGGLWVTSSQEPCSSSHCSLSCDLVGSTNTCSHCHIQLEHHFLTPDIDCSTPNALFVSASCFQVETSLKPETMVSSAGIPLLRTKKMLSSGA